MISRRWIVSASKLVSDLKKLKIYQDLLYGINDLLDGFSLLLLGLVYLLDFPNGLLISSFVLIGINLIYVAILFIYFPKTPIETEQQLIQNDLIYNKTEKVFIGIFYACILGIMITTLLNWREFVDLVTFLLVVAGFGSLIIVLRSRRKTPIKISVKDILLFVLFVLLISLTLSIGYFLIAISIDSFYKGIKNIIQYVHMNRPSQTYPDLGA
jgi:uncharacterized oligopeptide transporter (OPT) family protein